MSLDNGRLGSTTRFSGRVDEYDRYRPGYPDELVGIVASETGIAPGSSVADIGSGTGISSALFLSRGYTVFGVEPNAEMRAMAELRLRDYPQFYSVEGTAEETTLGDESVDLIVAAQSFHWFDRDAAAREFRRILAPVGWIVLVWNTRRLTGSPFLAAYEEILQRWGTDYGQVSKLAVDEIDLQSMLVHLRERVLYNEQLLDLDGLKGRVLSSSYTPKQGDPRHVPMLRDIERIFEEHSEGGLVGIQYDTEVYIGRLDTEEAEKRLDV